MGVCEWNEVVDFSVVIISGGCEWNEVVDFSVVIISGGM